MLSDLIASPAFCRKFVACWLSMLALVFAFEAKTAWYGPPAGPGSAVSSAKALPADLPQVVLHGVPVPDPVSPALPFLILAGFVLALSAGFDFRKMRFADREARTPTSWSFVSPQLFFRPPPVF
jgi:hypothetical protein